MRQAPQSEHHPDMKFYCVDNSNNNTGKLNAAQIQSLQN